MSSHALTVLGYILIVLGALTLEAFSYLRNSRIPSLGTALSRIMRTRSGRVGIMAGWVWLGLHFLAR
jgi:hypothetical protein